MDLGFICKNKYLYFDAEKVNLHSLYSSGVDLYT